MCPSLFPYFHVTSIDILINEFVQTILKISLKAKSINEIKYNRLITFLDACVNNIQSDCERFKERNGPSNIYDDKQLKLLQKHETAVKIATSLEIKFDTSFQPCLYCHLMVQNMISI